MNKIALVLKSRTFWTLVVIFIINGFNGIHNSLPTSIIMPLDAVLGLLATYFHINPSQDYKG